MSYDEFGTARRPLRIAVLVKQVPQFEDMAFGPNGRLQRDGIALEMNPYCRRAVAKGTELAQWSGGACTVLTLGPPSAEDCLREAVAWGADVGVLITDPAFAGSDTLATARTLAAALGREGPFDLILMGRNSVDSDTGQVAPELAEMLGLPFLVGAKSVETDGDWLRAWCELDDGWRDAEVPLPAVVSCAERLCDPCKVDQAGRDAVDPARLRTISAAMLGAGPWGEAASPTSVGEIRGLAVTRMRRITGGDPDEQVQLLIEHLAETGALEGMDPSPEPPAEAQVPPPPVVPSDQLLAVVLEPGRRSETRDILAAAASLAGSLGASVEALVCGSISEVDTLSAWGADHLVLVERVTVEEDVAHAIGGWCREHHPVAVLATGTSWVREVAGRVAAMLGAGLTGDAVDLTVDAGRLVAWKPAFGGQVVAAIRANSPTQMVTVRPGSLPRRGPRAAVTHLEVEAVLGEQQSRVTIHGRGRDDDIDILASASSIVCVGAGIQPADYPLIEPFRKALGAELGATRRVTDKGWMPHSRQIGITGRSVSPRLYVGLGLSGKFNHTVGFRGAGLVVAINSDPAAPIFDACDLGLVGDWRKIVPLAQRALDARRMAGMAAVVIPDN